MNRLNIQKHLYNPVSRDYFARILAYSLSAVGITYGIFTQTLPAHMDRFVLFLAIYPHFGTMLFSAVEHFFPGKSKSLSVAADALIFGSTIVAAGLPPVASIMLVMVMTCSSMIRFGLISLVMLPILMLASGGVTLYIYPQPLMQPAPLSLTLMSALLVSVYMVYLAWVIRQRQRGFLELKNRADEQQKRYTLLANNLTKYLSPQVWHSIFAGRKSARIESQRKKLTVFFSDIKGFTELSEELEAEALTEMLNQYLTEMSKIALKYGGTIDKFVGDSIMIFFGDPKTRGPKKDALAAVSMAIAMRRHMKILRNQWRTQGVERPLQIRMGINTGYCTVGNFGAENRMDYTLIGKEVNLASRLESLAEANQILISHETWSLVKDTILCQNQGEVPIKGFSRLVHCYKVVDFRRNLGERPTYMDFETRGFSIYLDKDNIDSESRKEILENLEEASKRLEKSLGYEVEAVEKKDKTTT